MARADRYLSSAQAAAVYDRVGRWQDTQGFYERPAVDALVRAGRFEVAASVVEVGCGTGALAARLLTDHLPDTARYVALDVSSQMVSLAQNRLRRWSDRVQVAHVDGHSPWPLPDAAVDRVVAAYVLDLLAPPAMDRFFAEAARVLRPGGLVATVSLAPGSRGMSRLASAAWTRLWRINPHLTGGCRPLDTAATLPAGWRMTSTSAITRWTITSAVMIAEPPATEDGQGSPVTHTVARWSPGGGSSSTR